MTTAGQFTATQSQTLPGPGLPETGGVIVVVGPSHPTMRGRFKATGQVGFDLGQKRKKAHNGVFYIGHPRSQFRPRPQFYVRNFYCAFRNA